MIGKTGRWSMIATALLVSVAPIRQAMAQWSAVSFGVAEVDTKATLLLLAGISATPKAMGLQPVVGIQAYSLGFKDFDGARTNVFAVRPGVGLGYNYEGGEFDGTIGYQFTSGDNRGPVVAAERGQGVDIAGGWEHWGTGGPLGYQTLASYNFGGKSFWGRGRVTTRVSQQGKASTRLGGEVAYLSGPGYWAWQPGGVYEWHFTGGQILGLGAGGKFINGGGSAAYFRVEGLLPLTR